MRSVRRGSPGVAQFGRELSGKHLQALGCVYAKLCTQYSVGA